MDNTNLKAMFIDCLSEKLKLKGFKYEKSKNAFVRKVDFGEEWYTFNFFRYNRKEGFEINPGYHLRFEKVESFFHETSNFDKKDQKHTTTIGCSIENHLANGKDMFRQNIVTNKDIFIACNFYLDLFKEIVSPFFNSVNSLENLNNIINTNPEIELEIINPIFRGMKGVIIAYFVNFREIDKLINIYSKQYNTLYNGFYKCDFDRLIQNIKNQNNYLSSP